MGKVNSFHVKQKIPASLEEVWRFFSDARNLLLLTPPHLNLKVTNEVHGNEMYAGQILLYKVKPLFGIQLPWMTEITQVQPFKYFIDEQRKGPYKFWHHQHHFAAVEGGVEMTDIVHYRLPFGLIGNIANRLLIEKELNKIFNYRYKKIIELFGEWKGQESK